MTVLIIALINCSFDESHRKVTYFSRNNSFETLRSLGFSS